jgi:hypothetical protein
MKYNFLILVLSIGFFACSKGGDTPAPTPTPTITPTPTSEFVYLGLPATLNYNLNLALEYKKFTGRLAMGSSSIRFIQN